MSFVRKSVPVKLPEKSEKIRIIIKISKPHLPPFISPPERRIFPATKPDDKQPKPRARTEKASSTPCGSSIFDIINAKAPSTIAITASPKVTALIYGPIVRLFQQIGSPHV